MEAELRKAFESWISASPMEKNLGRRSSDPTASAWPGTYKSYEVQLAWEAWQEAWNRRPSVPPGERERRIAEALLQTARLRRGCDCLNDQEFGPCRSCAMDDDARGEARAILAAPAPDQKASVPGKADR